MTCVTSILCIAQEALAEQYDELKWCLNEAAGREEWVGVFAGRDDGRRRGEGVPILFLLGAFYCESARTVWLSDTPDAPGSVSAGWGNRLPRCCTCAVLRDTRDGAGGHRFVVVNTHLDHESGVARQRGLAVALRALPHGCHGLVCGDFNAGPSEAPTLDVLRTAGLRDAADVAAAGGGDGAAAADTAHAPTFHGFGGVTVGELDRIDYIFVTPGGRVGGFTVDHGRYSRDAVLPSDHYPVFALVAWD